MRDDKLNTHRNIDEEEIVAIWWWESRKRIEIVHGMHYYMPKFAFQSDGKTNNFQLVQFANDDFCLDLFCVCFLLLFFSSLHFFDSSIRRVNNFFFVSWNCLNNYQVTSSWSCSVSISIDNKVIWIKTKETSKKPLINCTWNLQFQNWIKQTTQW